MNISPDTVTSNLSAWIKFFGFKEAPTWINDRSVDTYATWIICAIFLACIIYWNHPIIKWLLLKLFSKKKYIHIRFTKGLHCDAYQEISPDGSQVLRYLDMNGAEIVLPDVTESGVVNKSFVTPDFCTYRGKFKRFFK